MVLVRIDVRYLPGEFPRRYAYRSWPVAARRLVRETTGYDQETGELSGLPVNAQGLGGKAEGVPGPYAALAGISTQGLYRGHDADRRRRRLPLPPGGGG